MQPRTVLSACLTGGSTVTATTTTYCCFAGSGTLNGTRANAETIVPFSGRLSRFYLTTGTAQPSTGSLTAQILVNGVASGIIVTVAADAAAGVVSDTSHSVPIAAGSTISIELINGASTSSAAVMNYSLMLEVVYPAAFAE